MRTYAWMRLTAISALFWVTSCDSSNSGGSVDCTPGEVGTCQGSGFCTGTHVCNAEGNAWSACTCGTSAGESPATRSQCTPICERSAAECGNDLAECTQGCVQLLAYTECSGQLSAWLSCLDAQPDICVESQDCDSALSVFSTCAASNSDTTCPFVDDGECDEPEGTGFCPEGSDVADCSSSTTCPFVGDGECDEPEGTGFCPEGSDVADCGACVEGSVGNTCWPCDGECDEPEGTGLCGVGSDQFDCAL